MKARSVGTFLEIGGLFFNMARVVEGSISDDEVCLHFLPRLPPDDLGEEYPVLLKGERREAFLEWWERQAALTMCTPHRISPASACCPSTCWVDLGAKRAGPGEPALSLP